MVGYFWTQHFTGLPFTPLAILPIHVKYPTFELSGVLRMLAKTPAWEWKLGSHPEFPYRLDIPSLTLVFVVDWIGISHCRCSRLRWRATVRPTPWKWVVWVSRSYPTRMPSDMEGSTVLHRGGWKHCLRIVFPGCVCVCVCVSFLVGRNLLIHFLTQLHLVDKQEE